MSNEQTILQCQMINFLWFWFRKYPVRQKKIRIWPKTVEILCNLNAIPIRIISKILGKHIVDKKVSSAVSLFEEKRQVTWLIIY